MFETSESGTGNSSADISTAAIDNSGWQFAIIYSLFVWWVFSFKRSALIMVRPLRSLVDIRLLLSGMKHEHIDEE
jgi:hypothetical protein